MSSTEEPGYDPVNDEYTTAGAMEVFGCSRSTLNRHFPPGTKGRRVVDTPGQAGQVRYSGDLIRSKLPLPTGGEG